ncbi:head GIN domain-containing protein [Chloroflexota bacterium]
MTKMSARKIVSCVALVIIMSMLVIVTGCVPGTGPAVTGSGKLGTRDMDYSDFTKIEVGYAFDIDITKADSYSVRITVDDNLYEYLDINKRGDTLHIGLKPNYNYVNIIRKATINLPDLRGLGLSGASKANVMGFSSSHSMDFDLSGASHMYISNMKTRDIKIGLSGASSVSGSITMADGRFDLSGASSLELGGSAIDVSIGASGASHGRLRNLSVVDASVNLSGASDATINAAGRVDGSLSGASKLYYTGNPTLGSINASGGSTISRN